jgi:hypothetical protein
MTVLDILAAGNALLQNYYKNEIPVYGREVSDGYSTPAFFTEVVTNRYQYGTTCHASLTCSFKITYFQKLPDSVDQMKKVEEIRKIFGQKLPVGDRKITVSGYDVGYTGERNNVLQITIDLGTIIDWIREEQTGIDDAGEVRLNLLEEG